MQTYNIVQDRDRERNWDSVKLKSQQLFIQTIERRTVKFNYHKVFVSYGSIKAYFIFVL